ncbi:unnamed protein product [Calicophoron daubneyi]|uniref:C2H2-type domain-containing protein n=1 Tax=Calicophoron daubneyi TaxID=300641 RepID=A0AAV2TRH7_CALDB
MLCELILSTAGVRRISSTPFDLSLVGAAHSEQFENLTKLSFRAFAELSLTARMSVVPPLLPDDYSALVISEEPLYCKMEQSTLNNEKNQSPAGTPPVHNSSKQKSPSTEQKTQIYQFTPPKTLLASQASPKGARNSLPTADDRKMVPSQYTDCQSPTSPVKRPRFELPENLPLGAHGLPCPCGHRFSDPSAFIGHARHCTEFALSATSFAEAAAAVASSGIHSSTVSTNADYRGTVKTGPRSGELVDGNKESVNSAQTFTSENLLARHSNEHPTALDLSMHSASSIKVDSYELAPTDVDSTVLTCSECDQVSSSLVKLHEHFESKHNVSGKYKCITCGETYEWLPHLLKHRLKCYSGSQNNKGSGTSSPYLCGISPLENGTRQFKDGNNLRMNSCSRNPSLYPDWLPGAHSVSAPRRLTCNACGKTGFVTTTDLLGHFNSCNKLVPDVPRQINLPLKSENNTSPLSQNPHSEPVSVASPIFHQTNWNHQVPNCHTPGLYHHLSSPSSPPLNTNLRCGTFGLTSTRFPLSFMPPLGFGPFQKSSSYPHTVSSQMSGSGITSSPKTSYRPNANGTKKGSGTTKESGCDMIAPGTDLSRPFKCCHCIKAFKSKALLDQHMHIHYPPKYTCRYCAKKYRWPPVFYHHQRTCKKRPPSSTGADTHTSTMTAANAMNSRTQGTSGMGFSVSNPSFSLPAGTGHFFSHTMNSPTGSQSTLTEARQLVSSAPFVPLPFQPTLPSMEPISSDISMNSGSSDLSAGLNQYAGPSTMNFAALAAAMNSIRLPFGSFPNIPPPLGMGGAAYGHSLASPPLASDLPSSIPSNLSLYGASGLCMPWANPANHLPTTPILNSLSLGGPSAVCSTAGGVAKPPYHNLMNGPVGVNNLLCVCGTQFAELPNYLSHLGECSTLQRLVQPGHSMSTSGKNMEMFPLNDSSSFFTLNSVETPTHQNAAEPAEKKNCDRKVVETKGKLTGSKDESIAQDTTTSANPPPSTAKISSDASMTPNMHGIVNPHEQHGRHQSDSEMNGSTTEMNNPIPSFEQFARIWADHFGRFSALQAGENNKNLHYRNEARGPDVPLSDQDAAGSLIKQLKPDESPVKWESPLERNDLNSPELSSQNSLMNSYSQMLPLGGDGKDFVEANSPGQLMAAMASVLANAAASVGLNYCKLRDTRQERPEVNRNSPPMNSPGEKEYSAPLNASSGNTAQKQCSQCGKEFSSRLSLKQHVEGKHSAEGKYQCPGCAKRYRWGASYYYHKKSCPAVRDQSPLPSELVSQMSLSANEDNPSPSSISPLRPASAQNVGHYSSPSSANSQTSQTREIPDSVNDSYGSPECDSFKTGADADEWSSSKRMFTSSMELHNEVKKMEHNPTISQLSAGGLVLQRYNASPHSLNSSCDFHQD